MMADNFASSPFGQLFQWLDKMCIDCSAAPVTYLRAVLPDALCTWHARLIVVHSKILFENLVL